MNRRVMAEFQVGDFVCYLVRHRGRTIQECFSAPYVQQPLETEPVVRPTGPFRAIEPRGMSIIDCLRLTIYDDSFARRIRKWMLNRGFDSAGEFNELKTCIVNGRDFGSLCRDLGVFGVWRRRLRLRNERGKGFSIRIKNIQNAQTII